MVGSLGTAGDARRTRAPARVLAAALGGVIALAMLSLPSVPVSAQSKASTSAASGRLSVAAARKAVGDGKQLIAKGRHGAAVSLLTQAISSRRLRYKEMAQALYQRGLAYRGAQKPAQAIEDLTAALWIKNGLPKADRDAALAARAATYEAAGLSGQGQTNTAALPATPPQATPATPNAAPSRTQTAAAPTGTAAPRQTAAREPAPRLATAPATWGASTQVVPAAASARPTVPSTAGSTQTASNTSSSFTDFFSNLFSGGATGTPAPSTTASLPTASSVAAPSGTAVSGWSSQTSITPTATATRTAARPATQPRGRVRMQVAAVRGESRAKAIASEVNGRYASALGGRAATVKPVQIGNLGRMYRVELGPFAKERDSRTVCAALRKDGYDCLRVQ
ncbi:MAG: SPOR domain-containing protein [Pseudomonadota bacterium]